MDVLSNELSETENDLKKEFGEDRVITSVADVTKEEQFTGRVRTNPSGFSCAFCHVFWKKCTLSKICLF